MYWSFIKIRFYNDVNGLGIHNIVVEFMRILRGFQEFAKTKELIGDEVDWNFSFYFRKFINRICFRRSEPFQKSRLSTSIIFSLIFKFYFCIKASPGHEQIIKPNELTFLLIERIYSHDNNKKCFYKLLNENTVQMKWRRKKVYFTQILWQKKTIC